ncbi:MAG: hypothetical protein J6K85_01045 [Clostridia bacterium]|nr:hypothetical protein [Clostridia bacterium]
MKFENAKAVLKAQKNKKFKKALDKSKKYVIILKCIILAFFFGGFLPFFQGKIGKNTKKSQINLHILPKTAKFASATRLRKFSGME